MTYRKRTLELQADRIEAVLAKHKVNAHVRGGIVTPRFVQFRLHMDVGMKVKKISSLAEEIAMALGKREARIYRKGGDINVEVPRSKSEPVRLLPLCSRLADVPEYTCVLGVEEDGTPLLLRLTAPDVSHILIAGTTGSGKTGVTRTVLTSLAAYNSRDSLLIRLVDPKGRGLAPMMQLPNVQGDVASSPEAAVNMLGKIVDEMELRDRSNVNSPRIVVAVDELADLIQTGGSKVEGMLTRISQRGRESGIHLIACTQKPTANLIGGAMKANFPVRLVGLVANRDEARYATGVTESGAEKLEGKGDFLLIAHGNTVRFQAAWTGPRDLMQIVDTLHEYGPIRGSWPASAASTNGTSENLDNPNRSMLGRLLSRNKS